MRTLLLTTALMLATPVDAAACHRYARWYYPYPQRCYTATASAPLRHRANEQSHDWYVEFVLPEAKPDTGVIYDLTAPALTDEERRARDLLRAKQEQPK
jgi:hypothetical protein